MNYRYETLVRISQGRRTTNQISLFFYLFRNAPEVIATVRDYVRTITPETPDAYMYSMLKNALFADPDRQLLQAARHTSDGRQASAGLSLRHYVCAACQSR
jgi:hypothetical protein